MNKQLTYVSLFTVLLILSMGRFAQAQPSLHITSDNIGSEVSNTVYSFTAGSCLLSIAPAIKINATGQFSPVINPIIPLSKIWVLPTEIGSGISLLAGARESALSQSPAIIYSALLGALSSTGTVTARYRIPAGEMASFAWQAGVFTVPLSFTTPGGALCLGTSTSPATFTLTVDPFITITAIPNTTLLNVNNFDAFRTTGVAQQATFNIAHTVKLSWSAKANATLAYTDGYPDATDPHTSSSLIQAQLITSSPVASFPVTALSSTATSLINNGQMTIPLGNQTIGSINYSVSPANLRAGFLQKGTYSTPVDFVLKDADQITPVTSSPTSNLTIQVADMGELLVNNPNIELKLASTSDYQNGVSIDVPNHLKISRTSAYDVYVNSSSNYLVDGAKSISADVIQIGPGDGQTGLNTIQLSSIPKQLISGSSPCLDRNVNIQYKIGQADAQRLFGQAAGTYSTTITYSFTAP